MRAARRLRTLIVVFSLPCVSLSARAQAPAAAPAPAAASATTGAPATAAPLAKAEIAHFLETATIVRHRDTRKGVTGVVRLTLQQGNLVHDAAFSSVEQEVPVMRFGTGQTEFNFVDSYTYSIAAYRLAELLGLDDMMPVTVERKWDLRTGALSWWVDAKWDEEARRKQHIEPPDPDAWNRQMHRMRVFTALVADTDRNLGNLLISADWKLWMIDFTRAFRRTTTPTAPAGLTRCDRHLLAALRSLRREQVAAATKRYLRDSLIDALMARRDAIVALFDQKVAAAGEASVLY